MNKEVKHSTGFRIVILCFLVLFFSDSCAQDRAIKLIVRADDIGAAHSINEACIEVYKNGIARSVEIMVPCPWYPEAVKMLKEVPGYDVGCPSYHDERVGKREVGTADPCPGTDR
jgi:hypothetical protein